MEQYSKAPRIALASTRICTMAVEANMRHIARHEAKPNPKPISAHTLTRGFEAFAFPKIVRELKDSDLVIKQKALLAARELLGSPTSYVQCIAHGITAAVVALLKVSADPGASGSCHAMHARKFHHLFT